jgi:hypothetical protein
MSKPRNPTAAASAQLGGELHRLRVIWFMACTVEDTWKITRDLSVNFGSRWDRLDAFSVDSQFSPTINFVLQAAPRHHGARGLRAVLPNPELPGDLARHQ